MQLDVDAGLPLLPLLDGQLGTIDAFMSCSSALYVPSKLDAELLKEAQSSLVDLSHFDRESSDRCHLRHTALILHQDILQNPERCCTRIDVIWQRAAAQKKCFRLMLLLVVEPAMHPAGCGVLLVWGASTYRLWTSGR